MKKILLFSGLLFFATSFFSLKAQTIPEVQSGNRGTNSGHVDQKRPMQSHLGPYGTIYSCLHHQGNVILRR